MTRQRPSSCSASSAEMIGFSQADHIGDENATIGFEHLLRGKDRILLILQLLEILR